LSNRNRNGTFKDGKSGNPAGAPKGVQRKIFTDEDREKWFGKRTKSMLDELYNIGLTDKNINARLKAIGMIFGEEKEVKRRMEEALKAGAKDRAESNAKDQPISAPVISLTAKKN
jgi:hypothetical protein